MIIRSGFLTLLAAALAACGSSQPADDPRAQEPTASAQRAAAPVRPRQAPPATAAGTLPARLASTSAAPVAEPRLAPAAPPSLEAPATAPATEPAEEPAAVETGVEDAATILRRAERAYAAVRSLQADFVQDLTVPLLDRTQRSRGTMYHRRPDRFLMKFSDPAGDVVVADGRYVWLYYPSTDAKQVIRTSLANGAQQVDLQREFLSNPTARFNATLHGVESVGGRPAHVLTLVPRASGAPYRKVRIWVDQQDALLRRFEMTEQNESVRRVELRNLKVNLALADALFRFTPPANAQVFEQ